jgi:hypothetical protein
MVGLVNKAPCYQLKTIAVREKFFEIHSNDLLRLIRKEFLENEA